MVLRIDTSAIVSLALECTLYGKSCITYLWTHIDAVKILGASVMMFVLTLYILCRGRSFRQINHWNVARASTLFLLSTIVSALIIDGTLITFACSIFLQMDIAPLLVL
jgi:hypothetical protein